MNFSIQRARSEDLEELSVLEKGVEPESPAGFSVLQARLSMFGPGFLTAWQGKRLVGYAQSCLWNEASPRFSAEDSFFPSRHREDGTTLYIIFVGVEPQLQRHGIGSGLIRALIEVGRERGASRVQAVTWPHFAGLYLKLGFTRVKELPGFLPRGEFILFEKGLAGGGA